MYEGYVKIITAELLKYRDNTVFFTHNTRYYRFKLWSERGSASSSFRISVWQDKRKMIQYRKECYQNFKIFVDFYIEYLQSISPKYQNSPF